MLRGNMSRQIKPPLWLKLLFLGSWIVTVVDFTISDPKKVVVVSLVYAVIASPLLLLRHRFRRRIATDTQLQLAFRSSPNRIEGWWKFIRAFTIPKWTALMVVVMLGLAAATRIR